MDVDPLLLLRGETPLLLDEWQEQPRLWNYVRREVDDRKKPGQFILTGSATPRDDAKQHSGAGRFSRITMRPMSLYEANESSGQVSLSRLLAGDLTAAPDPRTSLDDILRYISVGGWPGLRGLSVRDALKVNRDYLELASNVDVSAVGGVRRDPGRVRRLMASLARNVATEASIRALSVDVEPGESLARDTVRDYLGALARLSLYEPQPAWSAHLRSSATLRKAAKHHFVDPSLAVAAVGADVDSLRDNLNFAGLLFESLVVRDLRVYSQPLGGRVFHARDSASNEVDAIVQLPGGEWAAFEVKLGAGAVEQGAKSLLRFADQVVLGPQQPAPTLTVITGSSLCYRRPDGVNVVPIALLGP